jgi:hypothetical protein
LDDRLQKLSVTPIKMAVLSGVDKEVNAANEAVKQYQKKLKELRDCVSDLNWNDYTSKLYADIFTEKFVIDTSKGQTR